MGVQGLTSLLQRESRPSVKCIHRDHPIQGHPKILLVDASTVQYSLVQRVLGTRDAWAETNWHQRLYLAVSSFYQAIISTGLIPVLILDGAQSSSNYQTHADRKRNSVAEKEWAAPLAASICKQAYLDLGLEIETSVLDADRLLIAWYRQNESRIFAVLTDDSDFFVLGVRTVIHFKETTFDDESVTLHLWDVDSCWRDWQKSCSLHSKASLVAPRIDLLLRAQVAAILGNDVNKAVRRAMEARASQVKAAKQWATSPSQAARSIVLRGGRPLDLSFFRNRADDYKHPGLGMNTFDETDLSCFDEIVQSYLDLDKEGRRPGSMADLLVSEGNLPWLDSWMVQRLRSSALPRYAVELCSIGISSLTIPPGLPSSQCLKVVRGEFACTLLSSAPGPAYQYDPNTNTLIQLNEYADGSRGHREHARQWFVPEFHLPTAKVKPQVAAAPAKEINALRMATPAQTMGAIEEAYPDLAKSMVIFNALLVHAASPPVGDEEVAAFSSSIREVLLPNLPLPGSPEYKELIRGKGKGNEDDDEDEDEPAESLLLQSLGRNLIDVGSQLSQDDWDDIDNDDTVNKVKASPGFALMSKIVPYDPSLITTSAGPVIPEAALVELFYLLAYVKNASSLWEKLMGSCFPSSLDPIVVKELKAKRKSLEKGKPGSIDARVEEIKKSFTISPDSRIISSWLQSLMDYTSDLPLGGVGAARSLLAVCRHGYRAGPHTPQWSAATLLVQSAPQRVKRDAWLQVWGSHNSSSSSSPGSNSSLLPSRHPHQQTLIDIVSSHLSSIAAMKDGPGKAPPLPLRVILSTPTGSGKTFLALMLHLQVLSPPIEGKPSTQRGQQGHPDVVLVYCVPTKQVLKKVGTECEAHRVVYWTAAAVGGDLHEVRRPYSVRRKQKGGGNIGSSSIQSQLELCERQARQMDDIRATPVVIIADVKSTAALVQAASSADPDSWYHSLNLVLYFDEPNMGIHIDLDLKRSVKKIMRHAPFTTILASATLPSWENLPRWWKGKGGARRGMVTLEPYGLPQSNLEVMVSSAGGGGGRGGGGGGRGGLRVPVNILQLFRTLSGLLRHLRNDERRRILLLRHVSPEQANQLISLTSDEATDDTSDWSRLGMDVRTLRSEYIERLLLSLNDPSYAALRKAWTQPVTEVEGLRSLISKNGVTMIATLDPRRLALELTGWSKDAPSSSWIESKAALREKVKAAKDKETANKKAAGRSQKKDEENSGPTDEEDTTILLRSGLKVGLGESEGTEDDILCMLSKGVAYVRANEVEPLVQMLYRNALLHLPDRVTKQPPIHVLVVDYSAIYGTDCQAVDTLYMCEDLGELLSFEDHQQFIGRLRRDGTAIYPSLEMLRKATLGIPSAEEEEERMTTDDVLPKKVLTLRDSVAALMNSCDSGNVSTSQLTAQLRAIKVRHGDAVSVAEVNAKLLVALLLSFDEEARPEKLFSLLEARLRQWGGVEPIKLLNLKKPEDQSLLISACREACVELPALIKATPRLLQFLYNEELIEDEAFLIWKAKDNNSGSISPFRSAINPLLDWIENADEESSDELT